MNKKLLAGVSTKRPMRRYDRPGHIDPEHAERLLSIAREAHLPRNDRAFLRGMAVNDDLAEELAESAIMSMTTGEDAIGQELGVYVVEEDGGPFVETPSSEEFASGSEAPNIPEATREPIPLANAASAPEKIFKLIPPLPDLLAWGERVLLSNAARVASVARQRMARWKTSDPKEPSGLEP